MQAGLAAIGAANSLGAIVRALTLVQRSKEQVQSMGASFLEIDFKEEGGSGDGYAKVMSEEFNRRAMGFMRNKRKWISLLPRQRFRVNQPTFNHKRNG